MNTCLRHKGAGSAALVLTLLALAGCSGGSTQATTPAPVASVSPSATAQTATASPAVVVLTKEQAGVMYLRIVKPGNRASARMKKYTNHHATFSAKYMTDVRRLSKAKADTNRQFSLDLLTIKWPADVRPTVRQLLREVTADQAGYRAMSKARTATGLLSALGKLGKDKGAAELLRQQLGLPERT